MGLPSYNDMRLPILRMLADGKLHGIRDVIKAVAAELGVAAEDRKLLTPKTRRPRFDIGVTRCVTDLRKAGMLKNTELGRFCITGDGQAALSKDPRRIDLGFLRENSALFCEWEASVRRGREAWRGEGSAAGASDSGMVAIIDTPGAGDSWGGGAGRPAHGGRSRLLQHVRTLLEEGRALDSLAAVSFSDTLFVTAKGSHEDLLLSFGRAVWPAIVRGIREGVPVRGCVACGRFLRDKDGSVAGPAADEAAAYYRLPQWAGISAAPSANAVLSTLAPGPARAPGGGGPYAMHSIPLGTLVEQGAWAVNWPGQCDESGEREIEEIAGIMEVRIETAPDIESALRWRNTRRFCDSVLAAA